MDASLFLAKVMGLFLVIYSLSMLLHPQNFISIVTGIFHQAAIQFTLGLNLLIIGTLMVVSHNIWDGTWVMVVTIVSWLVFIKGILYISFPKSISAFSQAMLKDTQWIYVSAAINLLLGLYLSYMGFFAS